MWIIDKRVYAEVVGIDENPNSFLVKTKKRSVILRNRWHLIYAPYKDEEESEIREEDSVYLEEDMASKDEGSGKEQLKEVERGIDKCGIASNNEVVGSDRKNSECKQTSNQKPKREIKPNPRYRDYV